MTRQQKRLRRENYCGDDIYCNKRTYRNREIKSKYHQIVQDVLNNLEYYGTIQDLYDYEFERETK